MTLIPGSLAEGSARHGHLAVHDAHRGIEGAQEHPQIRAAHQVHHGMERLWRRGGDCSFWVVVFLKKIHINYTHYSELSSYMTQNLYLIDKIVWVSELNNLYIT